jgi:hypothetical protein
MRTAHHGDMYPYIWENALAGVRDGIKMAAFAERQSGPGDSTRKAGSFYGPVLCHGTRAVSGDATQPGIPGWIVPAD